MNTVSLAQGFTDSRTPCFLSLSTGFIGFGWDFVAFGCGCNSSWLLLTFVLEINEEQLVNDNLAATQENEQFVVPTRSDTNWPVQSKKKARGLRFWI